MKAQLRPRWVAGIAVASLSALITMILGVAIVHGKASVAPLPIPGGDLISCPARGKQVDRSSSTSFCRAGVRRPGRRAQRHHKLQRNIRPSLHGRARG